MKIEQTLPYLTFSLYLVCLFLHFDPYWDFMDFLCFTLVAFTWDLVKIFNWNFFCLFRLIFIYILSKLQAQNLIFWYLFLISKLKFSFYGFFGHMTLWFFLEIFFGNFLKAHHIRKKTKYYFLFYLLWFTLYSYFSKSL